MHPAVVIADGEAHSGGEPVVVLAEAVGPVAVAAALVDLVVEVLVAVVLGENGKPQPLNVCVRKIIN